MKELQELPMLLRNRKRSFSCSVLQHKSRECSIFQNNVSLENQMPKESHILQIALLKKKIKKKRGKEQAMVKAPSFKALCQFPRNIKDQCIHQIWLHILSTRIIQTCPIRYHARVFSSYSRKNSNFGSLSLFPCLFPSAWLEAQQKQALPQEIKQPSKKRGVNTVDSIQSVAHILLHKSLVPPYPVKH